MRFCGVGGFCGILDENGGFYGRYEGFHEFFGCLRDVPSRKSFFGTNLNV